MRLFPNFDSEPIRHPKLDGLRSEVRDFIAKERAAGRITFGQQTWTTWDRSFSERCAKRGYIAMTWPKKYGGHERSAVERYVVCEELLAAGAPQGAHWIADRQSGPQIIRYATEAIKKNVLPEIAAGRCTICIGMSEPDSGSDLSSIRTRAERVDGGFEVHGRKVWTTNAQHSEYIIALCRTEPKCGDRYAGLSQLIIPLRTEGITVRPLVNLAGVEELNEVVFDGCFVPNDYLLGKGGDGWKLVTQELSFERSGPDRFLSTFGVLSILAGMAKGQADRHAAIELGRLLVRLSSVRCISLAVMDRIARNEPVDGIATVSKELGTSLEQDIPDVARRLLDIRPKTVGSPETVALATAILNAPCFSLRGGTREILKGIIAKELGLR